MPRADFMVAVGDTDHPPAEWMWEELEAEVSAIKKAEGIAFLTDREALATDAAQQAIMDWKRRNKLISHA